MGQKIVYLQNSKGEAATNGEVAFECPGCKHDHVIPTKGANAWGFNGNADSPTFTPSLLVRGTHYLTDEDHKRIMAGEKFEPIPLVCHSFITDGKIQFLGDCTHELKNQTVDLYDISERPDRWK